MDAPNNWNFGTMPSFMTSATGNMQYPSTGPNTFNYPVGAAATPNYMQQMAAGKFPQQISGQQAFKKFRDKNELIDHEIIGG